jgi:hypothetical protein
MPTNAPMSTSIPSEAGRSAAAPRPLRPRGPPLTTSLRFIYSPFPFVAVQWDSSEALPPPDCSGKSRPRAAHPPVPIEGQPKGQRLMVPPQYSGSVVAPVNTHSSASRYTDLTFGTLLPRRPRGNANGKASCSVPTECSPCFRSKQTIMRVSPDRGWRGCHPREAGEGDRVREVDDPSSGWAVC